MYIFSDIDGYLMVDDKTVVFADGKQILTNSEWSKVNVCAYIVYIQYLNT